MKFGSQEIPSRLFTLARDKVRRKGTFTPELLRSHLQKHGAIELGEVSPLASNQWLVADRVMRAVIKELVAAGKVAQVKRGLWTVIR